VITAHILSYLKVWLVFGFISGLFFTLHSAWHYATDIYLYPKSKAQPKSSKKPSSSDRKSLLGKGKSRSTNMAIDV